MIEEYLEKFTQQIGLSGYSDPLIQKFLKEHEYPLVVSNEQDNRNQYYSYVILHKVMVFEAAFSPELKNEFGFDNEHALTEHMLLHDLSKFSAQELGYVGYNFQDKTKNTQEQVLNFQKAWHHHKLNNPHHPEHWLSVARNGQRARAMPMPRWAVAEMLADWVGAGKTYGSSIEEWLPKNVDSFLLHPETRRILKDILSRAYPSLARFVK